MRDYINKFKGSALHVFMAIALRTDSEGWCYPNISLIAQNAGVSTDTVHTALNELCKLTIDGSRVLMRVKTKHPDGTFANNRYLIFPTASDIEKYKDYEIAPDTLTATQIVEPKKKTNASEKIEVSVPPRPAGQPAKERFKELLGLYEQCQATGKKLVYNGAELRNTSIIIKLVEELFGKGWPVEYSYVNKLIKDSGNHWNLFNYIFSAVGTQSAGNPWTYIQGIVNKNKAKGNNTVTFTKTKTSLIVPDEESWLGAIPGKSYEDKLNYLAEELENPNLSEETRAEVTRTIQKIYKIINK
jgi:hypothetical protein